MHTSVKIWVSLITIYLNYWRLKIKFLNPFYLTFIQDFCSSIERNPDFTSPNVGFLSKSNFCLLCPQSSGYSFAVCSLFFYLQSNSFFCWHQTVFFTLALCYHLRLDVVIAPASFTFFRIALGICRILWCIMISWFLFYPKPLKYDMGMLVVFTLIL